MYQSLVFIHLLLFVFWLGADVGVYLLGQHFRKRFSYSLDQRLALLKLLVEVDMVPRTAWALMVPITLSLVTVGRYLAQRDEIAGIIVGMDKESPVYLSDVAQIIDGSDTPVNYVWHGAPTGKAHRPKCGSLARRHNPDRNRLRR